MTLLCSTNWNKLPHIPEVLSALNTTIRLNRYLDNL